MKLRAEKRGFFPQTKREVKIKMDEITLLPREFPDLLFTYFRVEKGEPLEGERVVLKAG